MQRFYFSDLQATDTHIAITDSDMLHQLHKVLRAQAGDQIILFNGKDTVDRIFEIDEVEKREVLLHFVADIEKDTEIDFELHIVSALPNKLEKVEYLLQKATEIGVTHFRFFRSERSQKLNISENKKLRCYKIIAEATEQSGRNKVPHLIFEDDLHLEEFIDCKKFYFHPDKTSATPILQADYTDHKICIFTGPEGGFSDEELFVFEEQGFEKIYLGERILRAETVPVVGAFCIIQSKA